MMEYDTNKLSEALNILYRLEDKYDYDETETGLKIGTAINKLQELL